MHTIFSASQDHFLVTAVIQTFDPRSVAVLVEPQALVCSLGCSTMCDGVLSAPPLPSFLSGNRKLPSAASAPTPGAGQFPARSSLGLRNPPHAGHSAARSAGGAGFGSRDRELYGRLGLKDGGEERFELGTNRGGGAESREGSGIGGGDAAEGGNLGTEEPARRSGEAEEGEEVPLRSEGGDAGVALRREEEPESRLRVRGGRQVMRRSSMVAKQVISIESALGLGFVSQLWVDTASVSGGVLHLGFL